MKYYDAEGKLRTHRLDQEAGVLVTTEAKAEAEKYAEVWYRKNVEHSGPAPMPVTRVVAGDAERITFEQFGRLWTTSELAKRYPDHVKLRRTANADEGRLRMYVYPDEDAKLLACREIPLVKRLFYGLLAREGFRVSELLLLEWSDLDLDRGAVNLDENKTDEPRTWALDPGDVEALRRWKKHFAGSRAPSKPVLVDRFGNVVNRFSAAEDLREYLKKAGVHRPQLFEASGTRIRLRAHDLRATFVTVNLVAGKTEAWITDRTGHKSSQMIYRYKRQAWTHAELNLGTLTPLHEAIPELAEVKYHPHSGWLHEGPQRGPSPHEGSYAPYLPREGG